MAKILFYIPDTLAYRMKRAIPARQLRKVIIRLIEAEVRKREKKLYECAVAVENDSALKREMQD